MGLSENRGTRKKHVILRAKMTEDKSLELEVSYFETNPYYIWVLYECFFDCRNAFRVSVWKT